MTENQMKHEELTNCIQKLSQEIKAEEKANRIRYREISERLEFLETDGATKLSIAMMELKDEVQKLKRKLDQ